MNNEINSQLLLVRWKHLQFEFMFLATVVIICLLMMSIINVMFLRVVFAMVSGFVLGICLHCGLEWRRTNQSLTSIQSWKKK